MLDVASVPTVILLRILVSLLVTAYLAWEDARTSFMNEKLLYAFVAGGFVIDLIFLSSSYWLFVFGLAIVLGLFGFWSYKTGQFGGGDVLLLLGLHLWLPFSPFAPVPWPFVLSVFLSSAIFASLASAGWYAWKLRRFPLSQGKKLVFAGASVASLVVFTLPVSLLAKMLFFLLLESALFYLVFRKELLEKIVIQHLTLKRIEDEDVMALEHFPPEEVRRFGLERVLTKPALVKLKKYLQAKKKKTVPIYKDLPRFGPFLLAGLVVSLLVGDLVWFLLMG